MSCEIINLAHMYRVSVITSAAVTLGSCSHLGQPQSPWEAAVTLGSHSHLGQPQSP